MTDKGSMREKTLKIERLVSYLLPAVIFSLALWTLDRQVRHLHSMYIVKSIASIPLSHIELAFFLTFLSYLALTGYDYLAVRHINHPVPYKQTARVSFISTSISYNVGFNILTGSSLRYRLYSRNGLDLRQIWEIIVFCIFTFWIGFCFVGGLLFTFYPVKLSDYAPEIPVPLNIVGILLLLFVAAYFFLSFRKWSFRRKEYQIRIPEPKTAFMQLALSSVDYLLSGSIIYFLLPSNPQLTLLHVLVFFALAQIIGLISTVPGGLGVFETLMLFMLEPYFGTIDIIRPLLIFRTIYYFVPFLFGFLALIFHEYEEREDFLKKMGKATYSSLSQLVPQIFSVFIFLGGVSLLFSGALPSNPRYLYDLTYTVPLPLIEFSRLFGSIMGVLLLLLANGLWKRIDGAYILSLAVLLMGGIFALLKDFDYFEAVALFTLFFFLLPCRKYFYRKSSLMHQSFSRKNVIAIILVLVSFVWLGFFSYRNVEYSNELWWQFGINSQASSFLRATVGTFLLLLVFGMARMLSPFSRDVRQPGEEEMELAKTIINRSQETAGNLVFTGDKYLLFDDEKQAFLMYGISGKTWVAMGDLVGTSSQAKELIWDFYEMSKLNQGRAAFYEVSEKYIPVYLDLGLTLIKIGEEAKVPLEDFTLEGSASKDFRYTVRNVEKKGYRFEIVSGEAVLGLMPELRQISDAWLEMKAGKEKRFSIGFFDEKYLINFPVALVRNESEIVAFANIWPSADNEEISVDLMRHSPNAPDRTMEYLFVKLMLWGQEKGYRSFSLGMAPLSGLENRQFAPVWHKIGALIFAHGEHFYNYKGLRDFKEKFNPVWSPRYIALPKGFKQGLVLKDIAALISGGMKGIFSKENKRAASRRGHQVPEKLPE
ncbi:bifunctional lysylphosphatidylglycerol flippase/synthetase MprF [Methanosarcina sp.]|uniref:bifunctional lysylphosphatidylglycerol flippase/synthetase MprF n=1 Tax=Methanosarcina sp. TaxID=2213 RepID=UPI003C718F47